MRAAANNLDPISFISIYLYSASNTLLSILQKGIICFFAYFTLQQELKPKSHVTSRVQSFGWGSREAAETLPAAAAAAGHSSRSHSESRTAVQMSLIFKRISLLRVAYQWVSGNFEQRDDSKQVPITRYGVHRYALPRREKSSLAVVHVWWWAPAAVTRAKRFTAPFGLTLVKKNEINAKLCERGNVIYYELRG